MVLDVLADFNLGINFLLDRSQKSSSVSDSTSDDDMIVYNRMGQLLCENVISLAIDGTPVMDGFIKNSNVLFLFMRSCSLESN